MRATQPFENNLPSAVVLGCPRRMAQQADASSHRPALTLRDIRIERLARRIEKITASANYGCLMAMLPELEHPLTEWAKRNIDPSTLVDDGIETETHATVLYGWNEGLNRDNLANLLSIYPAIELTLGKLSRFECPKYDVIKFSVESEDLMKLNSLLASVFEKDITASEYAYNPHVTIAYVAKGSNKGLDASEFEGKAFRISELLFSGVNKTNRRVLKLKERENVVTAKGIVTASIPPHPLTATFNAHDAARSEAEAIYRKANAKVLALAEAAALQAAKEKESKAKQKRREREMEAIALLILLAGIAAYKRTYVSLQAALNAQSATLTPLSAQNAANQAVGAIPSGLNVAPNPVLPIEIEDEAKAFSETRAVLLVNYENRVREKLEEAAGQGILQGETEQQIHERIQRAADELEKESETVSKTETQAVYGASQLALLKRAGFKTKLWITEGDERVRDSHVLCEQQGEVGIDNVFHNGLKFPGDPKGGPEECCNCRCTLIGGTRL